MKIRVFEAFSGIGAQAMSLKRLQAEYPDMLDFEFVGTSEIEPSAIKAYTAVHGDVKCYGDITKIDWSQVPDFDLFTMSSPCQDFSVAGRQAGAEEGSGTRSSLLWECRKAIIAKKPRYILFENVSAVVSKKFIRGFNKWQAELESYGYTNFAKVLNSKDFGICQNRERLFMISILDCTNSYHFPEPFKLEKRIKDILEPYGAVDESFYFSAKQLASMFDYCKRKKDEGSGFQTQFTDEKGIASCVTTRYGASYTDAYLKEPALHQRLSIYADNAQAGRVYDVEGISPTVKCYTGGNSEPKILEPVAVRMIGRNPDNPSDRSKGCPTEQRLEFGDNIANCITTVQKDSMVAEPMVGNDPRRIFGQDDFKTDVCPALMAVDYKAPKLVKEPMYARIRETLEKADLNGKDSVISDEYNKVIYDDVAPTITTRVDASGNIRLIEKQPFVLDNLPDKTVLKDEDGRGYLWQDGSLWRVRKLTGLEVMRLMDVADEDYYKMKNAGISKTAIYSLAGNSIVVNLLYHIFRKLWIDSECESAQKSLFDF